MISKQERGRNTTTKIRNLCYPLGHLLSRVLARSQTCFTTHLLRFASGTQRRSTGLTRGCNRHTKMNRSYPRSSVCKVYNQYRHWISFSFNEENWIDYFPVEPTPWQLLDSLAAGFFASSLGHWAEYLDSRSDIKQISTDSFQTGFLALSYKKENPNS